MNNNFQSVKDIAFSIMKDYPDVKIAEALHIASRINIADMIDVAMVSGQSGDYTPLEQIAMQLGWGRYNEYTSVVDAIEALKPEL